MIFLAISSVYSPCFFTNIFGTHPKGKVGLGLTLALMNLNADKSKTKKGQSC